MRVAVISDIHGNCIALDAVLDDLRIETVDQVVCLGDAVQGGPQPRQVIARLRELGCPVVMGNADHYLLNGISADDNSLPAKRLTRLRANREWAFGLLDEADRAFIAAFPPTVTIPLLETRALFCFHGSPASFDDLIFPETPEEEFQNYLGAYSDMILTGGHTHLQQLRRAGEGDSFFFNPGSVGYAWRRHQAEDQFRADHWAEYAMLTVNGDRIAVEFRRVPFDVHTLIEVYRASGRPYADEAIRQYQLS